MSSAMAARALCMGLEIVTASGEVMDLLPALKKNNTGYDLVNLMVGIRRHAGDHHGCQSEAGTAASRPGHRHGCGATWMPRWNF